MTTHARTREPMTDFRLFVAICRDVALIAFCIVFIVDTL